MNKELIMFGSGIGGGAVSNGLRNLFPVTANPLLVDGGLAIAAGIGAYKATGTFTGQSVLKNMLIGATIVRGIAFTKALFQKTGLSEKLSKPTKVNQFLLGATGLGCPSENGLNVFVDEYGNVHEGLAGYDDEEMLNGFDDEEEMLNGFDDEEMLNGYDDEDSLNGYEEEAGLFGVNEKDHSF